MEPTWEDLLPIYGIEAGCILSRQGDYTAAWRVHKPEIFQLSGEEYESLHQAYIRALKVLPVGAVVHQQDWYTRVAWKPDRSSDPPSWLDQSSDNFFDGRPWLDHESYLFLTKRPVGRWIAALHSYDDSIEDGNDLHEAGLSAIAADKQADFNLHSDYFASFTEVNTRLSGDPKVAAILKMTKKIVTITDSLAAVRPGPPALRRLLEALCRGLISECTIAGRQLQSLLTDGAWHLNDAQRIEALDVLHANVQRIYNVALTSVMELPTLSKMQ